MHRLHHKGIHAARLQGLLRRLDGLLSRLHSQLHGVGDSGRLLNHGHGTLVSQRRRGGRQHGSASGQRRGIVCTQRGAWYVSMKVNPMQ